MFWDNNLGFVRRVAANGGGGRAVVRPTWTTGRTRAVGRPVTRVAPRPVVTPTRQVGRGIPQTRPTAESIPYYDPSRVIDPDRLKVVKDLRAPEFAEERGDVTSGDTGATGPGSGPGTFPTRAQPGTTAPGAKPGQTGLLLAALAAALLLGGA